MLRRSSSVIGRVVQYRSLAPSQRTFQYATAAGTSKGGAEASTARVALRDDLKRYLKPDVLKVIEGKTDSVLIKKLNFLGRNFVCRLNVANKLILNSLSQDNVFRLLVKELQDPWSYYWHKICKNGKDPQKWLQSLKEVAHLPGVVDRCFREMTLSGVYPVADHFNVLIGAMAQVNDNTSIGVFMDELIRVNTMSQPTAETYLAIAWNWARQGNYFIANHALDYLHEAKFPVPQDLQAAVDQLKATYDPDAAAAYYQGRGGDKPQFVKERDQLVQKNQSKILTSLDECLQPPLEKLVVVDEQ